MRLQRGQIIAGLPAEVARSLVKACHSSWTNTDRIGFICKLEDAEIVSALEALRDEGYLDQRVHGDESADSWTEWTTTVKGAALAMGSFAKPISRKKADELLAGVLQRALEYNADEAKPLVLTEVRVFGSYLDESIQHLGDLDVDVSFEPRTPEWDEPEAKLDYARQSGRRFSTFIDQLFWPHNELLKLLRARSSYINIHVDEVRKLQVEFRVVFPEGPSPARRTEGSAAQ